MIAKKFFYLCSIIFCACNVNIYSQNIEQIYIKDGSVLEGYIAEQIPGKSIIVQSEKATIVVSSDSLQNRLTERIPVESLTDKWRIWAEQNGKLIDGVGGKLLELTTLEFENTTFKRVFLLEKGSLIKFLDLDSNIYTFVWGDMYRTVKSKRPDNLFSDVKEILVFNDGTRIVGQIIEQFPGKDLKILTDKGEILSFKFNQIKQIKTEKLSGKWDLWSQIKLLDRIQVKGEHTFLEGFISSRTLSKELVIEFENGDKRRIPLNLIVSYGKIPNKKYVPVYDKVLKKGDVLLNGKPACFVQLKSVGNYLALTSVVSAQAAVGDTLCVEMNLDKTDIPVMLVKAHVEDVLLPYDKKRKILWPVITYQDLLQSHADISREVTPLGNVKVVFVVSELGDYVLYIQGKEGYIVINVTEKQ